MDICWFHGAWTARETGSRHGQPPHHSTLSVHSQLHVLRPIANKAIPSPMRFSPSRSSTTTLVTMKGYPLTRPLSRAFKSNSDLCGVKSRMSLTVFFSHVRNTNTSVGGLSRVCLHLLTVFHLDPSIDDVGRPSKPGAAAADDSTPCLRRSLGKDTYPHVFCVLPLLPITSRGRSTRCIATRISSKRARPCIRLSVGQLGTFLFECFLIVRP